LQRVELQRVIEETKGVVVIDEAYVDFAADNCLDFAREYPNVIVARTFSKIAALAGMRLGYGIAPTSLIQKMEPYVDNMSVNILAKWGGAAALKDTEGLNRVRNDILQTRKKTTSALTALGYAVIPSETNFFMVNLRQNARPVIHGFRQHGILVGRPFPPMDDYLRVSVGTPAEMERFLAAFESIMKT